MGRIEKSFKEKKPLIIYATACDPDFDASLEFFRIILRHADIVEVGMPFSDPLADGPTIQKAHERALKSGATTEKVFELVSVLRDEFPDKGLILMGYYNPVFVYGEKRFIEDAASAGVDGFIIPDLPPEEGKAFSGYAKDRGLSPIFLAAPTSTDDRLKLIAEVSGDFIYYVSLTGTTGVREELDYRSIKEDILRVRRISGKKVVVGFGISRKKHIISLYDAADGFVVGSAVVRKIEQGDASGLEELLMELKSGIKEASNNG
ncbi:tryptophan synthase subunit alpha [Desulfurobacterium sp.]